MSSAAITKTVEGTTATTPMVPPGTDDDMAIVKPSSSDDGTLKLNNEDSTGGDNDNDNKKPSQPPKNKLFTSTREWIAGGVGGATIALHGLHVAMLTLRPPETFPVYFNGIKAVGYIASGAGAAVAPYAVYNETQLVQEGSLRSALNNVRSEVNRFSIENEKLTEQVNELEKSVGSLKEIETSLTELTTKQGSNLETFMSQIKENKKILSTMKALIKARAVEDVVTLVLRCDRDGDFFLEGFEIEELIMGIGMIDGIELDEESFREQIEEKKGNVRFVLQEVKKLIVEDDDDDDDVVEEEEEGKQGDTAGAGGAGVQQRRRKKCLRVRQNAVEQSMRNMRGGGLNVVSSPRSLEEP